MAAESAVTSAVEHGPTAGEYVIHHLHFWQNKASNAVFDMSVIHIDTVIFSILLAAITFWILWAAARKASSGVPGRFQAAVEILVEFVDNETKGIVKNVESRKFVAPLGLSIFIWVTLMNTMDLLPVDLLPTVWAKVIGTFGGDPAHAYLRVLPTADVSGAMGLSVAVLLICLYYNVKIKGLGGWAHELVTAPFGTSKNPLVAVLLGIVNFAMQIIEFASKTLSHGLRLFGNMYAGELIFMLIALMGGAFALTGTGIGLFVGHIIAGLAWAIFHILIIILQAFIFMMLALVYIGQAHDHH
ncbi:MAG: F0F1 ATP synthase subunit A [Comamonas sp. SCN 67-35]|uniref:F0F1 ATP synthase subunit A n=1 Tax=unclassified Comamonas TaxID=2638500 RepID=UPI0008682F41|nr:MULTISPECIES: F0F1 ATP synthase subunit A [unclassified Comamonas]MBN9331416.1 F0F1 ATP synthase subunit A [Comamonas sp.]ODU37417.1 MAG: F0F1 ATP synthase subunit A [Comamonas sp. SCN 67-35]OJX02254.1 MAG: F0F1 ATP synthase subunit A [Burkholderiales bacterium 66-26]